jgi:hypothetical protein
LKIRAHVAGPIRYRADAMREALTISYEAPIDFIM